MANTLRWDPLKLAEEVAVPDSAVGDSRTELMRRVVEPPPPVAVDEPLGRCVREFFAHDAIRRQLTRRNHLQRPGRIDPAESAARLAAATLLPALTLAYGNGRGEAARRVGPVLAEHLPSKSKEPSRVGLIQAAAAVLLNERGHFHRDFGEWAQGFDPAVARRLYARAGAVAGSARRPERPDDNRLLIATALKLVLAARHLKGAGEVRVGTLENFADYFDRVAACANGCAAALGLDFSVRVDATDYDTLYRAAKDTRSDYAAVGVDDPWVAELRALRPAVLSGLYPFSNHLLAVCFRAADRPRVLDALGHDPALGVDLGGWKRIRDAGLQVMPAEGNVQNQFSVARQMAATVGDDRPSADALRGYYREFREGSRVRPGRGPEQPTAMQAVAEGGSRRDGDGRPWVAALFLGHAVAVCRGGGSLDFLPFRGGGVRGQWSLAYRTDKSKAAQAVAQLFAKPLDEMIGISHGLLPTARPASPLHGRRANEALERRLRAAEGLLFGPSFLRFEEPRDFMAVAAEFSESVSA